MNVSKMKKATLVAEYTALYSAHQKLLAEARQLRQLNADWAYQSRKDRLEILKLKDRLTAAAPSTASTFQQRCAEYCAEHNVRSVPFDVAQTFRARS